MGWPCETDEQLVGAADKESAACRVERRACDAGLDAAREAKEGVRHPPQPQRNAITSRRDATTFPRLRVPDRPQGAGAGVALRRGAAEDPWALNKAAAGLRLSRYRVSFS